MLLEELVEFVEVLLLNELELLLVLVVPVLVLELLETVLVLEDVL